MVIIGSQRKAKSLVQFMIGGCGHEQIVVRTIRNFGHCALVIEWRTRENVYQTSRCVTPEERSLRTAQHFNLAYAKEVHV